MGRVGRFILKVAAVLILTVSAGAKRVRLSDHSGNFTEWRRKLMEGCKYSVFYGYICQIKRL